MYSDWSSSSSRPSYRSQRQRSGDYSSSDMGPHRSQTSRYYNSHLGVTEPSYKRPRVEESRYTAHDSRSDSHSSHSYEPPTRPYSDRKPMNPPSNTLIIRNIANGTDPTIVKHCFEQYGRVEQYDELIDQRGIVFVTYYDSSAAQVAFRRMQGQVIDGSSVDIQFEPLRLKIGGFNHSPSVDASSITSTPLTETASTKRQDVRKESPESPITVNKSAIGDEEPRSMLPASMEANEPMTDESIDEVQKLQQECAEIISQAQAGGDLTVILEMLKTLSSSRQLNSESEDRLEHNLSTVVAEKEVPNQISRQPGDEGLPPSAFMLTSPVNSSMQTPSSMSPSSVYQKPSLENERPNTDPVGITLPMLRSLQQALSDACAKAASNSAYQMTNSYYA
ncbi:hypothetical protein FB446DRAFT_721550 [Lentinula raphanica]|nr:hypothetical protein FB446DRAFT_721550 [Lentinula raphanica]